ncbi:MAG: response regulator [Acidobacteriota bacterium]
MTDLREILLAEDSLKDVELILAALEDHKLANEITVVNDGAQALDYLYCRGSFSSRRRVNPGLVLLDIKMPKVDGLEVLRILKSDENLKTIPVVILTSSREEKDLFESYRLGVNSYVVKPVNFHEFMEAVKALGVYWGIINEPPPKAGKASA